LTSQAHTRRAILSAAVLALLAMRRYPGGTSLDAHRVGYSMDQNFLSDLGMTVAYDGQPNAMGSALFVASILAMVLGFGRALWQVVQRYSSSPRSRHAARAASGVALVVGLAFVGVALTPEDRALAWHVWFTLLAFRGAPLVPLLLAIAAARGGDASRGEALGWLALAVVMLAYLLLLTYGPATSSVGGLRTMVLAQKLVTLVGGGVMLLLTSYSPVTTHRSP
jgi:hypothetical membrane protein